jgi:hypothetical protein
MTPHPFGQFQYLTAPLGHLVPAAWDRCRTIMQNALRPGSIEALTGETEPATEDGQDR